MVHWVKNSKGQPYPVHDGSNARPINYRKSLTSNEFTSQPLTDEGNRHHNREKRLFIKAFDNMAEVKKTNLLNEFMRKDKVDDFMSDPKSATANELAENYDEGREVLADISTKLGYDY